MIFIYEVNVKTWLNVFSVIILVLIMYQNCSNGTRFWCWAQWARYYFAYHPDLHVEKWGYKYFIKRLRSRFAREISNKGKKGKRSQTDPKKIPKNNLKTSQKHSQKRFQKDTKKTQKYSQKNSKMIPRIPPTRSQKDPEKVPKMFQNDPKRISKWSQNDLKYITKKNKNIPKTP